MSLASSAVPPHSADLTPEGRDTIIASLDGREVDVLVIGGGVTGMGIALDAAARGLSVLLVERRDIAAGTSSRSSKLIHGGLRYLEQLNFALVREALEERGRLVETICPHLVHPLAFLYPLQHRVWERPYVAAGVGIYDALAAIGGDRLPRQKHFTRQGALERFPALKPDAMLGAVQYWDAQVDDARHTTALARTAASFGAEILTSVEVVAMTGTDRGRVDGAVVVDREGGKQATIRAGVLINATGPWTEETEKLAGQPGLKMRTSKGVHIVVPRDRIDGDAAIISKTKTSVLFIIPFGHNWLLGTTDTDWSEDLVHPSASGADVQYLLAEANKILATPLSVEDVSGVFSGLRPLIASNDAASAKLSREHATVRPMPGLVSVAGGKYTTYRVMAADGVDAALQELGREPQPTVTANLALHGAVGFDNGDETVEHWQRQLGVSEAQVRRLLGRYGTAIAEIDELIRNEQELRAELPGGAPYLRAEVAHAVEFEGARHVEDVLVRRTRLSFEHHERGVEAASDVAAILGNRLGWGPARRQLESDSYRARVAAERAAEKTDNDADAMHERGKAGDIRVGAFSS